MLATKAEVSQHFLKKKNHGVKKKFQKTLTSVTTNTHLILQHCTIFPFLEHSKVVGSSSIRGTYRQVFYVSAHSNKRGKLSKAFE